MLLSTSAHFERREKFAWERRTSVCVWLPRKPTVIEEVDFYRIVGFLTTHAHSTHSWKFSRRSELKSTDWGRESDVVSKLCMSMCIFWTLLYFLLVNSLDPIVLLISAHAVTFCVRAWNERGCPRKLTMKIQSLLVNVHVVSWVCIAPERNMLFHTLSRKLSRRSKWK